MSGHSKWHSIKHKKAATDAQKSKILTKHAKLLAIAGRSDPNPETNASLRAAIDNAKADNVPGTNIDRILKKLSGADKDQAEIQEAVYEGFGPNGIPFLVTALTDNPNRTYPEVRTAFSKHGGTLGSSGSVAFLFDHVGVIRVANEEKTEDELFEAAVNAGARDFEFGEKESEIITAFSDLAKVRDRLSEAGIKVIQSAPEYHPKDPKVIAEKEKIEQLERFMEAIEDVDDVDEVFSGFDVAS
ncbi:YebC/PmpR family DNA-binding transcriptional regulator [Candidatus Gracilibacteria bacterium]|nr:YebC/PmpR family DNA-binding transcriptional regulator [Candidatus Gracilibacteria bacterium]MCF7819790.1 YebC/PmpR family DNA-binding transcriptional regulator [Candidatus Gracilibacteria bacterium]